MALQRSSTAHRCWMEYWRRGLPESGSATITPQAMQHPSSRAISAHRWPTVGPVFLATWQALDQSPGLAPLRTSAPCSHGNTECSDWPSEAQNGAQRRSDPCSGERSRRSAACGKVIQVPLRTLVETASMKAVICGNAGCGLSCLDVTGCPTAWSESWTNSATRDLTRLARRLRTAKRHPDVTTRRRQHHHNDRGALRRFAVAPVGQRVVHHIPDQRADQEPKDCDPLAS